MILTLVVLVSTRIHIKYYLYAWINFSVLCLSGNVNILSQVALNSCIYKKIMILSFKQDNTLFFHHISVGHIDSLILNSRLIRYKGADVPGWLLNIAPKVLLYTKHRCWQKLPHQLGGGKMIRLSIKRSGKRETKRLELLRWASTST